MTNPTRLRRNTRFDKQLILSWIDEALLMTYLPSAWQSLESDGITGAIDLVWYALPLTSSDIEGALATPPVKSAAFLQLEQVAIRNKLDPFSLAQSAIRMSEDAQVRLIHGLYQMSGNDAEDQDA